MNPRLLWKSPVLLMTAVNALGACIAFGKDLLLARYLGTSLLADAFTLAYFIPDMVGNGLIGTAIGTVCIPLFSKQYTLYGHGRLLRVARSTFFRTAALSFLICLLCFAGSRLLIGWLCGWNAGLANMTLPLLLLLLPIVVLFPAAMVGGAFHQARERFFLPVLGPLLINTGMGAALFLAIGMNRPPVTGTVWTAWGIDIGVVVMTLLLLAPLAAKRETAELQPQRDGPELRRIRGLATPLAAYSVILLAAQALYLVERVLAARMSAGSVAALNYAFRLSQLPVWVFVAAFGTALLPQLSRQIAMKQAADLRHSLIKAFRAILLVTIPISILLFILREPLTVTLFQHGAFNANSVALTSRVLQGYSLMIVFQAISAVCFRFFLAMESLRVTALLCVLTCLVSVGADWLLAPRFGLAGLGYGALAGAALNAFFLLMLLHRTLDLRALWVSAWRIAAANLPPTVVALGWMAMVGQSLQHEGLVAQLLGMLYPSLLYAGIFWGIVRYWRGGELLWKERRT